VHDESRKAIAAAFLANLGIAIAKLVGFVITGASSMLAESIHSLADTGNQGLLVLGGRQAARPATEEHPFGYGRDRYFWAFVVAMVLFLVGGLFAIYEGIDKLRHPHEITSPAVALGILGVAVVLECFSLRTAVRASRPSVKKGWVDFIRRSKSPELPVVLLEDLGALVGLVFAFTGITLAVVTDEPRFDGAATLAIGLLLMLIAVILVVEMKSLLIGESATPENVARIEQEIRAAPHVRGLLGLRTLHLGPDELLVAAKIEFERDLTVPAIAAAINDCEARIRAAVTLTCVIYLEPDLAARETPAGAAGVS
jgi:cation diffusion facilitator family transporter